ncbi:CLUMA_CG020915, isoform A [Clunio marinus]|uniref:CLUMA_CG020915, isoform A n=1 Tax=Clunio marinus TaxID=568069 RepID=A0A1J1J7B8_9DIPT|nr:CLUMA_CG020915, isoform A [Clunio marinus]
MGFSAMQGKGVHEALLARQDAEIRLIETMRRCLSQKAKCDRDYATALVNVAQTGLKIDRSDDLAAWKKFMDEIEQQSKQIRFNAEQLENLCSDRMTQLYQDKRKSRKQYQEEHAKVASQFAHLTEEYQKKKAEYQKHLDYYKQLRMRFEEHYIKSGRAGRKLDDVRDKYQKACRKLHLAHNEYVLLIHEATEVEKDYRTILWPKLLENHQTQQEMKNLIVEASNFADLTSDKYADIQKQIDVALQSVNPTEEYRDFTEKHRSSSALPVIFRFDDQLIEDTVGKLQPNQLTVDNLTVDWLRQRITDLESAIKECQEKQNKLQNDSNGKISPSVSNSQASPINNSLNTSLNCMNGNGGSLKDIKFNKELSSLKCEERQKNKLVEIIRSALNEVSCEELPSGCDDLSVEMENNNLVSSEQMTHTTHMSMLLQKGGDFMTLLKTPFRRKRITIEGDGKRSSSTTPKSVDSSKDNSFETSPPKPPPRKKRAQSTLNLCEKDREQFELVHFKNGRKANNKLAFTSFFAPFKNFAPSAREKLKQSFWSLMTIATNRPLYEEEWFHGVLPREEVVRLLRLEGDFLVRETTRNDESQTVLSVCWNGHKHFIVQITAEGHFRFEGPSFPSIQELILHQYQSEAPVTSRSGAILKKPVLRERWELSNDDVILLDKIGRLFIENNKHKK